MKRLAMASAAVTVWLASSGLSFADMYVTETVTGTSGNYTLDFTVHNTLNSPMDVYFFGVLVDSGRDIVGSPTGFNPNTWPSWNNDILVGGSSLTYNNNWVDPTYTYLPSGSTLGGFSVYTTDAVAPTSVHWFAFANGYANGGGAYTGSDYFGSSQNPGFEEVTVTGVAVPEPSTFLIAGIMATAMGLRYYWRRRRAAA